MSKLKPPVSLSDHMEGELEAPVLLVEYGDFQCPHCAAAHSIIKKLQKKYKEQLALVFRHFPLAEIHEYATIAAISAEAAANQGKFWEMHDMIFENQSKLSTLYLLRMAESMGLNMTTFQRDSLDQMLTDRVDADFESGIMSGVNGTPSFYINGEKYNGAYDYDSMVTAIDLFLSKHTVYE